MRLKYQIFLTLITASALLIAIIFLVSSWSFSRGFLDYVNQNEINRLRPIAEELVYEYELSGNWESINDEDLRQLSRSGDRGRGLEPRRQRATSNNRESTDRRPNGRPSSRLPRNDRGVPPLALTNIDRHVVAGKLNPAAAMRWINLESDDKLIGYLGFPENARVDRYFDQVFEEKQKNTFLWTALAMILLSALLSIPLAGRIVRPLLNINKAVDEISGGNFSHRIDSTRRDELGELANNINTLGTTLEQNQDARQRWIAEISHELRTPLAVMRGELEALQDGIRTLDKSVVDSLHSETLSLGRLVDDLHTLSMSDIGALNYKMEAINLTVLLDEFLTSNTAALKQYDISLSTDIAVTSAPMQGDVQRIEQLLSNLLQNTCRYTDTGGELEIALHRSTNASLNGNDLTGNGQEHLVLDWFDSSPGVDAQLIPRLFEPLFRTDLSRNRELGGSGLGLSIAKRIVEAHHGSIAASESALGGLHIRISFPLNVRNT